MLLQSLLLAVGIFGVYFGAEWLVKGSSNLSRDLGIKPIIIGLTVIAFGTSSPELAVSLTASIKESSDIAFGNIIGSNIANIGLVLGITAMVFPLKVEKIIMRSELPLMIGISAVLFLMALDGMIGFVDGLVLFLGIISYTTYHIYSVFSKRKSNSQAINNNEDATTETTITPHERNPKKKLLSNLTLIAIGFAGLLIGAYLLVNSAIFIAGRFGISEMVIGLTVVAFGTSIPEMATSVVSALRKEVDICVGNIIGSNIFNILLVIGSVALIKPLNVVRETLFFELPIMLAFSIVLIPIIKGNLIINRIEGVILTSGYFVFIFFLFC